MNASVVTLLPFLFAGLLDAQSTLLWRDTMPGEISGFVVSPLGNVVVAAPGGFTALDPTTGKVAWRVSLLQPEEFAGLPDSPYGILEAGDSIAGLDLVTGELRWTMSALGPGRVYGYMATRGLLLCLLGEADSMALVAVDLASGHVRWRHDHPFVTAPKHYRELIPDQPIVYNRLHGEEPPLWVSDSAFLLYVSADGPVLVDANTGVFRWRATTLQDQRPPTLRDGYPQLQLDDSVVLVPFEKRLQAIRLRDGTPAWAQPAEFPSRIAQMELAPTGVLVRGVRREGDAPKDAPFVALVNAATGGSVWPEMWKRGYGLVAMMNHDDPPPNTSPFLQRDGRVYFGWNGDLYDIALDGGAATKLGKLRFKGEEVPVLLENRSDGILLLAAQNMLLVDTAGRARIQRYFPAPPIGWLAHLATVALRITLDAAEASLAQAQANRTGVPQTYQQYDNPFLRYRYAAAGVADAYAYVLTTDRDSTGQSRSVLIQVPKDRDAIDGRVWLSEKHPPFLVDPFTSSVYVQTGPNELTAYRFPGGASGP